MSNVNHILHKLSILKERQTKVTKYEIKLGRVDDIIDNIDSLGNEMITLSEAVRNAVGLALDDAQELSNIQGQLNELYQDAMQTQVDIEDIGLDVPQNLTDAIEQAREMIDADVIVLINALQEAERVIYNG